MAIRGNISFTDKKKKLTGKRKVFMLRVRSRKKFIWKKRTKIIIEFIVFIRGENFINKDNIKEARAQMFSRWKTENTKNETSLFEE